MALVHSNGQLDAQVELYQNAFAVVKAMALKSAMDLRIADAIDHHGGAATLAQVAAELTLHPSKISYLRRLMRTLAVCNVFTIQHPAVGATDEPVYMLTPLSRLLVGSSNLVPFMSMLLHPTIVTPFLGIGQWFQNELPPDQCCVFKQTHGESFWELTSHDTAFDAAFNDAMVSDSNFIVDIVIKEHGDVFQGISSLVDVAGGLGGAAQAISKAFPKVKCIALDLGHVVAKAPSGTLVEYVVGDMFESVPPANAVLLKWVLHDWGHDECVKILKNSHLAPNAIGEDKLVYMLTSSSRLLVGSSNNLVSLTSLALLPTMVTSFLVIGKWFHNDLELDQCIFKHTHGLSLWELIDNEGISSLIDIVGGLGAAAQAISKVKCRVLDLGHVIGKAPIGTDMEYISGDMFDNVLPTNVVLLDEWADTEECKKAITSRDIGEKVIIIDMVVRAEPSDLKHKELQALYDMYIMLANGTERDEQQWNKVIFEARFSDYKITSVLGFRSIIKVYP
ncbi:hypothetical protein GUJ93_ZPchr0005g15872 [Zizania palustris]|uniref:Uncharacterized protein n=1 Tax=Zizania palustris TaxID=103762 RepID=A0A8J5SLD5_ZIZPA|nr:hypothetical protein GUJ93_ZPchr0005g15872 [Zizania palustris]